ncbi:MAG TPA: poly-beta-hydroxybutyrate polymerase N-terminal domain-containing protein, partial [Rhodanobacter sp.]
MTRDASAAGAADTARALPPPPARRDPDSLVHAAEGCLTLGLSPTAMGLACLDWYAHLANAPFRRLA